MLTAVSTLHRLSPPPVPSLDVHAARILIVDDVPLNAKVLQTQLALAGYRHCTTLSDATRTLPAIASNVPDLLILDLVMPQISGLEILEVLRATPRTARLPILVVTASESREQKRRALELGATDFLHKPVDAEELIPRVRNVLAVKTYAEDLERRVRERTQQLERARRELIVCLARAGEQRDHETGNHTLRVGCYAALIAEELGFDSSYVDTIKVAVTLHDLGKIAVPDSILRKPGPLNREERQRMQEHCAAGKRICAPLSAKECEFFSVTAVDGAASIGCCTAPLLQMAASIAWTHHERWDGSGYPRQLAGEDIPIEGRIAAVADVFDALSTSRPYKPALALDTCFAILASGRGTHFDPAVLEAFLARRAEIVEIHATYRDQDTQESRAAC
jgi:putative two-component system response regulator